MASSDNGGKGGGPVKSSYGGTVSVKKPQNVAGQNKKGFGNPHKFIYIPLLVTMLVLSACTLFQNDPTGATLLTMKTTYEASVRSAGQAHINGALTEAQLRSFVVEARKFYEAYNIVLAAHSAGQVKDGDPRLKTLQVALTALDGLVTNFILKKQ